VPGREAVLIFAAVYVALAVEKRLRRILIAL
jgi:hypothetical protein